MSYFLKKIQSKKDLDFFRTISKDVSIDDKEINILIKRMFDILYKYNAIGIAGVMVGVHKRIIVVDIQENNRKTPMVLINPIIIETSNDTLDIEESSISIDNVKEVITRPKNIKVKYLNENFVEKEIEATGLLSRCIQHEMDYIDGKLFIDYLQEDKRNAIINKIINEMKIKNIVEDADILRTKCIDVDIVDDNIRNTLDKMLETMYNNKGIGLAANQVGINKKLVVIDLQTDNIKSPLFLINPKIVERSDEMVDSEEGCLSVPNERAKIKRHKTIVLEYIDRDGNKQKINADGLLSICIQHETDHLIGKVYIDYLSKIKRDFIIKKVRKIINND